MLIRSWINHLRERNPFSGKGAPSSPLALSASRARPLLGPETGLTGASWTTCKSPKPSKMNEGHSGHSAAAKSLQSCPTLCDPIDCSPPGSPAPGILQARTLEWVAISFSNAKWKVKVKSLSHVQLFATPLTAAYQARPSMGFSRQEYWSGVPLPSPTLVINCLQIAVLKRLASILSLI